MIPQTPNNGSRQEGHRAERQRPGNGAFPRRRSSAVHLTAADVCHSRHVVLLAVLALRGDPRSGHQTCTAQATTVLPDRHRTPRPGQSLQVSVLKRSHQSLEQMHGRDGIFFTGVSWRIWPKQPLSPPMSSLSDETATKEMLFCSSSSHRPRPPECPSPTTDAGRGNPSSNLCSERCNQGRPPWSCHPC